MNLEYFDNINKTKKIEKKRKSTNEPSDGSLMGQPSRAYSEARARFVSHSGFYELYDGPFLASLRVLRGTTAHD